MLDSLPVEVSTQVSAMDKITGTKGKERTKTGCSGNGKEVETDI